MRTLLHLSDLHFGRVDSALIEPLLASAAQLGPDVVVVSGDLTQRARHEEFEKARHFLDRLPSPQIIVPGNHDVPLHNVLSRFLNPLGKYQRYICRDLEPAYVDDEMAVLGLNSARSLTIKGGRITARQIQSLRDRLWALDPALTKVVVSHHPFDLPQAHVARDLIGRAALAMRMFADCGADLLLAGHLHVSSTGSTAQRYKIGRYAALVVLAGTAISTRARGESKSFNVIRITRGRIDVERRRWNPTRDDFEVSARESFRRGADGWALAGAS